MAVIDYRARLVCDVLEKKFKQHSFYFECNSNAALFFDRGKPIFVIIVEVSKWGKVLLNAKWNVISFEEYSSNIEEEFSYVEFNSNCEKILEMVSPFIRTF